MDFVNYFKRLDLEQEYKDACKNSKPGKDKITYKKYLDDFSLWSKNCMDAIENKKYRFTKFELYLKPKTHFQIPRTIFKSTIRDRFVVHLISKYISENYDKKLYYSNTRNHILDEINMALKAENAGLPVYNYFLRLDISNYFDSINRELLFAILNKDKMDETVIYLISKIFVTMDHSLDRPVNLGVPQGLSVSALLSERYLKDLELEYSNSKYKDKIKLVRYVDDILVLVNDEGTLKNIKQRLLFELQSKYYLKLNDNKISEGQIENDNIEFLGIEVINREMTVSDNQYKKIRDRATELFKWYKRAKKDRTYNHLKSDRLLNTLIEKLNLLITGYIAVNSDDKISKYGWVLTSIPYQIENLEKLKKLDSHIKYLIDSYLTDEEKEIVYKKVKSFYIAFNKSKFELEKGYILNREKISNDSKEMYRVTCNLSMIDIKYDDIKYDKYDEFVFRKHTDCDLYDYFCKTLYIANRDITNDVLYW